MNFFKSLRFRLILLVLIAVIPALGIIINSGNQQRQLARRTAEENAYRLTRQVAAYQGSLIEGARQMLLTLSFSTRILEETTCNSYLKELADIYPMYTAISVASSDGRLICSSLDIQGQVVDISDRPYFMEALQSGSFVIGEIRSGLISSQRILPLAYPIHNAATSKTMVLVTALDLNQVLEFTENLNLPPQSAMLLVGEDGTILLRYPESEEWAGRFVPQVPIIQAILSSPGEGSAEAVGVDNVTRLYAFSPLETGSDQKVFLSVGIPSEIAYRESERILISNLAWLGLVILISLATAWFGGDVLFLRVVSLTAERDAAERRLREINIDLENRVAQRTTELAQANEMLQNELVERKRTLLALEEREAELKRLLQALERSNRDLQDFAYIASHDLQEPLRKIQAFGERLVKRYGPELGEEGLNYTGRMITSANRMQAMINDLLSYSRVKTHGEVFKPVNLDEVAEHVINNLEFRIREAGAKVEVDDLPTIEADYTQMQQLLQNLIGNALKFRRPGIPPLIKVCASSNHGSDHSRNTATITVEDNGIGFEEKYLNRIFQPFQRLHGREEYEGSGVGLAICRRIVERHGGAITANSTPGVGSRFVVTLPFSHHQEIG